MNAKDCIRQRRSIRKFKPEPVDHALLAEVVETASYAPSWKNTQVARYIAVEGGLKDQIAAQCTGAYPRNGEIIAGAPLLVAVAFVTGRSGFERDGSFSTPKGSFWQAYDAGIATEAFCLAAWDRGLGSVVLGIFDEAKAAALLKLPQGMELAALIPVGYPDEAPKAPKRKPAEELLSFQS